MLIYDEPSKKDSKSLRYRLKFYLLELTLYGKNSINDFTSLYVVGAPGCVALNGSDMRCAGQTTSVEEILPFWSFGLIDNFITRKQLCHLYCQTERMFDRTNILSGGLLAAFLDKGKATQVMELQILSGSCLLAPLLQELAEFVLQPRVCTTQWASVGELWCGSLTP